MRDATSPADADPREAGPGPAADALRRARSLTRLGRRSEALTLVSDALDESPDSIDLRVQSATLLRATGRFAEAAEEIEQLEARGSGHDAILLLRGDLALAMGDPATAERAFAAHLALRPNDPKRTARWIRALARQGRFDDAEAALGRCDARQGDGPDMLIATAELRIARGEPKAAGEAIERLALHHPGHRRIPGLRGDLASAEGEWARVERLFADELALRPDDVAGHVRRARALVRLQRPEEALSLLAGAQDRLPAATEIAAERVSILVSAGLSEDAERITADLARRGLAYRGMAVTQEKLANLRGDLEAAERIVVAEVAAHPRDVERRLRWITYLTRLDRAGDALDVLEDGLRDQPRHGGLLAERVSLLILTGRASEADDAVSHLRALDPAHPDLPRLRARQAEAAGDREAAICAYEGDAAAHPDDVGRRLRWLRALQHAGRIEDALVAATPVAAATPAETQVRIDCLLECGRWSEVDAILAAWPHDDRRGGILRHRVSAELALLRLDHDEVVRQARAVLAFAPSDHPAAQLVARSAACTFQTALAQEMLEHVRIRGVTGGGPARRGVGRLRHLVGQMTNEFRLRPSETADLAAASLRGAEDLATVAREKVLADPDSFGAALGLLTGLARSGRLVLRPAKATSGREAIPRIVHQFWDTGEPPPDIARTMSRTDMLNTTHAYRRWDVRSASRHLVGSGMGAAAAAFARARHAAMKADIFRLAILFETGGLYLDADDHCAKPLATLLSPGAELVCYQENIGSIGNNFIAVRPGHPIIGGALAKAIEAASSGASETLWLVTGPGLLSRAVASAIAAEPDGGLPAGLDVVPLDRFRSVVHTLRRASYKSDARSWKRLD